MAFVPPSKEERLDAIGSVEALPEQQRRAFTPAGDFEPVPRPGPSDWLANHPERGQSFAQFLPTFRTRDERNLN